MPARNIRFDSAIAAKLSKLREAPAGGEVSRDDVEGFTNAQKTAFSCAKTIACEIREGWSEKKIAKMMDEYLLDHGVKSFFHRSFAWIGDRSRFQGFEHAAIAPELTSYRKFMPSRRVIVPGEVVILDTAPLIDGYAGDIGYTFALGPHAALQDAKTALASLRRQIQHWFASTMTTRDIWSAADRWLVEHGFENRHTLYPFSVLGHRMHHIPLTKLPGLASPFSLQALYSFASRTLFPDLLGPFHSGDKYGIWAIEPHLGAQGFGAKFEELLIVERDRVYWLAGEEGHLTS
jgi:Xaa-Pro aminopeptidase